MVFIGKVLRWGNSAISRRRQAKEKRRPQTRLFWLKTYKGLLQPYVSVSRRICRRQKGKLKESGKGKCDCMSCEVVWKRTGEFNVITHALLNNPLIAVTCCRKVTWFCRKPVWLRSILTTSSYLKVRINCKEASLPCPELTVQILNNTRMACNLQLGSPFSRLNHHWNYLDTTWTNSRHIIVIWVTASSRRSLVQKRMWT